jgi:hypothetical protein
MTYSQEPHKQVIYTKRKLSHEPEPIVATSDGKMFFLLYTYK